jgi:hypothetical protein
VSHHHAAIVETCGVPGKRGLPDGSVEFRLPAGPGEGTLTAKQTDAGQPTAKKSKGAMKAQCILGHKWVGCRCERCGQTRDQDHDWDGCRCERCGLVRDHGHNWETVECRRKCRRCGWTHGPDHDWEGCVCRRCGATQHEWVEGVCLRCHERCAHSETTLSFAISNNPFTIRGKSFKVCKRCGVKVG